MRSALLLSAAALALIVALPSAAQLARLAGGALRPTNAAVARRPAPSGSWTGTFALPRGARPVPLSVEFRRASAVVSIGSGHPAQTVVAARRAAARVRFSLPGRPAAMMFDGRVTRGGVMRGTVSHVGLRGTFTLRRGQRDVAVDGLYSLDEGRYLVVADGWFGRTGLIIDGGEVRLLTRTGIGRYSIGTGLGDRTPSGTVSFDADSARWAVSGRAEERAARVPWRQEEVRVRSGTALLGCTLTIPPGSGARPAVAFAHGAGASYRYHVASWASFFASAGMVTLACDKRGIGQSTGSYPGERATERSIDQYARDVEAQARFLAAQPEVDDTRIGLSGVSQAGWIMPLAASREAVIRWLVLLVSPTVTQGESDLWGDLTGQGTSPLSQSFAAIEEEVRRYGPSGFDPMPPIRALRIPALWLYGAIDMHVPTRLSVARLEPVVREPGRDFTYVVFPRGNHALIETPNGLNSETMRSSRYVEGLFPTVRRWLAARGLTTEPRQHMGLHRRESQKRQCRER